MKTTIANSPSSYAGIIGQTDSDSFNFGLVAGHTNGKL